jgi:hypothetical protein
MAALASGKDAVVELSQGLLKKVIAQQANPGRNRLRFCRL